MLQTSEHVYHPDAVRSRPPSNPWLSIWLKPRGTIRSIVNYNPQYGVTTLAALSGIGRFLDQASERGLGDHLSLPWILGLAILLGSILGVSVVYLQGIILKWTGRWMGGQASFQEVRTAVAWASLPDLLLLPIFSVLIVVFGRNWFLSSGDWMDPGIALVVLCLVTPPGILVLFIRFFLTIKCLAEVHRFSAWKALLAVILGALIVMIPVAVLLIG